MTRLALVTLVLGVHLLAATAARADSDLSMQDLQALARQSQWTEMLEIADRVKPGDRTPDWARLITNAATQVATQIERASTSAMQQARSLAALVPSAEHKYAFLVSEAGYLDAKAKALQGLVTACAREAIRGCGVLVASLAVGIAKLPAGTATSIALLVADDVTPAEGVHFWALAIDSDKDTCKHAQLPRAVVGALRDASAPRQVADAQRAAGTCYAALEQALVDELVATKDNPKERPLYLKNACPVLKANGTPTIAKKKKCP